MLDTKELKIVLATLGQRRTWLLKQLETPKLDPESELEHRHTLKLIDGAMQKLAAMTTLKSTPPAQQPNTRRSQKKPHIEPANAYVLIAEDNADSAELLRGVLEDMGIKKVDMVEDGRAALYALQNCSPPYDIVLCDWDMPEMTGLEVRKGVKNLAKLRDTHFMMVTAISDTARIKEAIQHGVNDYIVKPIDIDNLEKKLRVALAGNTESQSGQQQQ